MKLTTEQDTRKSVYLKHHRSQKPIGEFIDEVNNYYLITKSTDERGRYNITGDIFNYDSYRLNSMTGHCYKRYGTKDELDLFDRNLVLVWCVLYPNLSRVAEERSIYKIKPSEYNTIRRTDS